MTAQLADQHPTAEYHHGDRPEGGGQEDVGAAGLRQALLPGRGGGLRGGGLPALGQPDNACHSPATGVADRIGLPIVGIIRSFLGIEVPDKDRPVLLAALSAGPAHLLTCDFWQYYYSPYSGERIAGVLIL